MDKGSGSLAVFVVEDEALLKMMIIEMLEELGHRVFSDASRIEQAIPLARTAEFDLALLDVNVAGEMITPVARIVAARNRPIVFSTGYGPSGIPEGFRDRIVLRKPFMIENLERTIQLAVSNYPVS